MLGQRLPPHMVPAAIGGARRVAVDGERQGGYRGVAGSGVHRRRPVPAPSTAIEEVLAGIYARSSDSSGSGWMIRSSSWVGIRCRRCGWWRGSGELDVEFPIRAVFEAPTVAGWPGG